MTDRRWLLGAAVAPSTVFAGDFIRFSPLEIVYILYLPGGPGLLVSLPLLWSALKLTRLRWFWLVGWCVLMPLLVFWLTMALSPALAGRTHVYSSLGLLLRSFGPGLMLLPALAFGLKVWLRPHGRAVG